MSMQILKQIFLNEKIILIFILFNCITLFIEGFHDYESKLMQFALIADYIITSVFLVEMIVKINNFGWKQYISSGWNKLDFSLVMVSIPSLITLFVNIDIIDLHILLVFRLLRAFRLLRLIEYVPGISSLIDGSLRALKTSLMVIFVFGIALFMTSIFSNFLFHNVVPEHFGSPVDAMYSIFKIFTIEGWFEVPDEVASNYEGFTKTLVRIYFIVILFTGGIIGLSLLNSIFVDAMVSDNNDALELEVKSLRNEIASLKELMINQNKNQ